VIGVANFGGPIDVGFVYSETAPEIDFPTESAARGLEQKSRTLHCRANSMSSLNGTRKGYYIASVPQLAGCHTQARSLDELTQRIRDAGELWLKVAGAPEQTLEFVGIQRITIAE
jgi:predicted RNase H-like HicB family nuclease